MPPAAQPYASLMCLHSRLRDATELRGFAAQVTFAGEVLAEPGDSYGLTADGGPWSSLVTFTSDLGEAWRNSTHHNATCVWSQNQGKHTRMMNTSVLVWCSQTGMRR